MMTELFLSPDHSSDCYVKEVPILGRVFSLQMVCDTNRLLESIDPDEFAQDERLPYWAELWSSSIAMAEFCLQSCFDGKRILELGCGLGLSGIAATLAGAHVTMTDYEPDALTFSMMNTRRNLSVEELSRVRIEHLDWRYPGEIGRYDLILGSDIIYEKRHFEPLLSLFTRALSHGGVAILTEPGRRIGEEFIEFAGKEGFCITTHQCDNASGSSGSPILRNELRPFTGIAQGDR